MRHAPTVELHHRIYAADEQSTPHSDRSLRVPGSDSRPNRKTHDESPVVMLHGLGSRGRDWVLQIETMRDRYRVVTVDLRGHGDSAMRPGWPKITDMAADVTHLLGEINGGEYHLVGLSLGGAVALQLAVDRPELVRSLTIVNAAATLRPGLRRFPSMLVRLLLLLTGQMDALGQWVARGLFPRVDQSELRRLAAERLAQTSRTDYLKAIVAILRFDLRHRVHAIAAPTLILAGELDKTIPLRSKRALAGSIPCARLEVIARSGHATPLDAPERFNALLLGFLAEQAAGSSPRDPID